MGKKRKALKQALHSLERDSTDILNPKFTSLSYHRFLVGHVQPPRNFWGGMGTAKPSVLLELGKSSFGDRFAEIYVEHVNGFGGKSFKNAGKTQEVMEWKKRLLEKQSKAVAPPKRRKIAPTQEEPEEGAGAAKQSSGMDRRLVDLLGTSNLDVGGRKLNEFELLAMRTKQKSSQYRQKTR